MPIQFNRINVFLLLLAVCALSLTLFPAPTAAQEGLNDLVTLNVSAGYDGYFRGNQWLPLRVEIDNNGDAVSGRVVVRPETSGSAFINTFSTPVDLASGSNQTLFLYVTARGNATRVRVELLNNEGGVVASQDAPLRSVRGNDRLYVVISQAAAGSVIDLAEVFVGGFEAFQANWSLGNLPDRAPALDAVDALLFNDVDTGALSNAQRNALRQWVLNGGHLIVTGGAAWQPTAAGLRDLLPIVPDNSVTVDGAEVEPLLNLGGDYVTELSGDLIVATGELTETGRILSAAERDTVLAARRELGNGTVDYLAVDPNTAPLREWEDRAGLWLSLLSSTDARPSWTHGFSVWDRAAEGVEILPGLNLLPAAIGLVAFLGAYVLLVGPLNYLVLNRLNRREWAWITIPVFILLFTLLARVVGFNLRGNQATLSRLSVIQAWPESDEARIDQIVGLLVPRRDEYSLDVGEERLMRSLPQDDGIAGNVLGGNSRVEIQQTQDFAAVDFLIDASIIRNFNTTGTVPRPDISGQVTLTTRSSSRRSFLQGAITNSSDQPLYDPVLLARDVVYNLGDVIEPGQVVTFDDVTVSGESIPAPSPLEIGVGDEFFFSPSTSYIGSAYYTAFVTSQQSATDILGADVYVDPTGFAAPLNIGEQTLEETRRQAFLNSFIVDQFASTSRGNRVYLAAWGESVPSEDEVLGVGWSPVDTTLYLIELEVEVARSQGDSVLITQDQFTWVSRERGQADLRAAPYQLSVGGENEVVFRFTPLPGAVLSEVDQLTIIADRPQGAGALSDVQLWNWREQLWESVTVDNSGRLFIEDPRPFLGPQNAVEVKVVRTFSGARVDINLLAVEQRGTF
ncbi:MAG: hypothetical protein SF029_18595 [bacterium]|nr:hypothetical protein [bacterium]